MIRKKPAPHLDSGVCSGFPKSRRSGLTRGIMRKQKIQSAMTLHPNLIALI
jgi:hypothetical protein